MSQIDVDRNLLFGVIALQADFIDDAQFRDGCAGWALRMETPLADLLIERGWIGAEDRIAIDRIIERKLRKHQGDLRASLGAAADASVRDAIRTVDHPAIRQSLSSLPPAQGSVLAESTPLPTFERGPRDPDPWTARARRWVRKHRSLVASLLVGLVMGTVLLAVVAVLQAQARAAQERSNQLIKGQFRLAMQTIQQMHSGRIDELLLSKKELQLDEQQTRELQFALLAIPAGLYRQVSQLIERSPIGDAGL
jgi:hypothetical protein